MSQEITLNQSIRVINGNFQFPGLQGYFGKAAFNADQAAIGAYMPDISAITTAQGTLVDLSTLTPAIAALGWVLFINLDAVNSVDWGPDNGSGTLVIAGRMLAGEAAGPFRANNQKFRFRANTLACQVQPIFFVP